MRLTTYALIAGVLFAGSAGAQTVGCARPGVVVMKGRQDLKRGFARMQIESIFNGVTLGEDQQAKAEEIISVARDRSPGVATATDEKHAAVMKERNEKLMALASSDADRSKITANLTAMSSAPNRCDIAR